MNSDSETIDKIKKLLALSSSSNPHEAAVALKRAQKLMELHNISKIDLDLNEISEFRAKISSILKTGRIYAYVSGIVAKAIGVEHILLKKNGSYSNVLFIGNKSQLELANYVFTVLTRQLAIVKKDYEKSLSDGYWGNPKVMAELTSDYECSEELQEHYRSRDKYIKACISKTIRSQVNAYLKGWISTVYSKIEAIMVTPDDQDIIDHYIAEKFPNLGTARARSSRYSREQMKAYRQGLVDGRDNFDLFGGITGSPSRKISHTKG